MFELLRTRIVARTVVMVLGIVLLVSVLFTAITYALILQRERQQVRLQMEQLLDTVESTASIACFLMDENLGSEVARGLLKNDVISHAAIRNGERLLTQEGSVAASGADQIMRNVVSPFNASEVVCQIVLRPNDAVIQNQVAERSRFMVYFLLLQAAVLSCGVAATVLYLIARPIKRISDQLHQLPIDTGGALSLPNGHRRDELGRLVEDVNGIVARLFELLTKERGLRVQREVGEKKYRAIFENAGTGIFVIDSDFRIQSCNRSFLRAFGIDEDTPLDQLGRILPDRLGPYMPAVLEMAARALAENAGVARDFRMPAAAGAPPKWLTIELHPVGERMLQGLVNDITGRKRAEESAYQLAATDPLTGLGNRLAFDTELARLKEAVAEGKVESFCLLMIDLDWFKEVNDTYGHDAGDALLRQFASILRQAVRDSDFAARLGGDEFVILLAAAQSEATAERIAQKIIRAVSAPLPLENGIAVRIGVSIGISVSGGGDNEDVVRWADEAMYLSKKRGKNTYTFHSAVASWAEKVSG